MKYGYNSNILMIDGKSIWIRPLLYTIPFVHKIDKSSGFISSDPFPGNHVIS